MRTKVYVSFNSGAGRWLEVQKLFLRTGCAEFLPVEPGWGNNYGVTLDSGDPRLQQLRHGLKELEKSGFIWSERQDEVYSDQELVTFPAIWLSVNRAPQGNGGPTYGTTYDLSKACPVCGTGAVQTSPLVLKASELKVPKSRDVFETLDGEIMISPRVAEAFKKASVSGVDLRLAVSHRDRSRLPWFQILPTHGMPRMAETSAGIEREKPCPRCGRDGYFGSAYLPMRIRYRACEVTLDKVPDFARTWECFGNSALREPFHESGFATPLLVVKPKVFRLLRELKVRGLRFLPVEIESS